MSDSLPAEAVAALERLAAARRVPGLALTLVRAGQAARSGCVGVADLATAEPLRPQHALRWYSLTKPVVAAAVLAVAEEGKLALAEPVGEQLPPWNRDHSAQRARATVLDLLGHSSGLRDRKRHVAQWFHVPGVPPPETDKALRDGLRRCRKLADGGGFHYSNLGYAALGVLLELADEQPLEALLQQRLLIPWGASTTSFSPPPDLARGHARRWGGMALGLRLLAGRRFFEGRHGGYHLMRPRELLFPAHGGLIGTISELGAVLHGLLTGAAPGGELVLSDAARARQREVLVANTGAGDEFASCGFGGLADAPEAPGQLVLYHGGHGPGFSAEMRLFPERGLALGLVGNADFDARASAIELAGELFSADA